MPRQNDSGELFKKITALTLFKLQPTTPGDTTTTAPVLGTGAETTVAVTAITNFTSGEPVFIIGDGGTELVTIGTPNVTMPVVTPPKIAQSTGARFVEAIAVSLGKIQQGSVKWTANRALTAVFEEVGDAPVVYIPGSIEFALAFSLYGYNGPNVQLLTGYLENETGSGAALATAYQSLVGGVGQLLQTVQCFRVQALRYDAKNVQIDFLNVQIEAAISSDLSRLNPSVLNGTAKCSALIFRQYL
jgi:hypothetical protein